MTVASATSRIEYAGNGVTTVFSFPYYYLANADLKVYVDDTLQTLTTHYTLTGAGVPAGGNVTMLTAPAIGETLVIFRDPEITQETDYAPNDPFPAETHEAALDKLTMIAQRNRDLINRAVAFSDGYAGGADPTLPEPGAGQFLRWNNTGSALETIAASPDDDTFTASGTGGVARSWSAKVGEIVSPFDFGGVGDGVADDSAAFQAMLDCGALLGRLPMPPVAWRIDNTVTWTPGFTLIGGRKTPIISGVASGEWTFVFGSDIDYADPTVFKGFSLTIENNGAHGIKLDQSRMVKIDEFNISKDDALRAGPTDMGGIGIQLHGGTEGCYFNVIDDNGFIYGMAVGIDLFTDDTTALANRNFVGKIHINNCVEGVTTYSAQTNMIEARCQNCTAGVTVEGYNKKNVYDVILENCDRPIELNPLADEVQFRGNVDYSFFVDNGGSAVVPHRTVTCYGTQHLKLPRNITTSDGEFHFSDPYSSGGIRLRVADGLDQDLTIGAHDANDDEFDLLRFVYDATAPYMEVANSRQLRMGNGSRLYWPSAEKQATVGAAGAATALPAQPTGYLKVSVAGVEMVVPYYAAS